MVTKSLLAHESPLFYSALRFLVAALILPAFSFKRFLSIPRSTWLKGSILGVLLYAGFVLQTVGLLSTTSSKSAFFTGMLVVLTPIVHYALQGALRLSRRPLRIGNLVGVACGAAGLYLLTSPGESGLSTGDMLTLGCALLFALYIVFLDSASSEPDKLQLTFVQFVLCGVVGMLVALPSEDVKIGVAAPDIISFLYLTIFATIIAMWVQNRFQGDTTPTRAAVIFTLEPVVAAFFGYFVRGEMLGPAGIAGAVTIVGGLILSEFSEEIPGLRYSVGMANP